MVSLSTEVLVSFRLSSKNCWYWLPPASLILLSNSIAEASATSVLNFFFFGSLTPFHGGWHYLETSPCKTCFPILQSSLQPPALPASTSAMYVDCPIAPHLPLIISWSCSRALSMTLRLNDLQFWITNSFIGIADQVTDAWFWEESCLSSVKVASEHSWCGLKKTSNAQDLANSEGSGENFMFEVNKQMQVTATPGLESMTNIWTVDAPLLYGYSSPQ